MDTLDAKVGDQVLFPDKWRIFRNMSGGLYILVRHSAQGAVYAPGYHHHLRLAQPHLLLKAGKFHLRYTDPSQLPTVADKLRWYRYQKGLRQRDVADFAGLNCSTYLYYEDPKRDCYPLDKLGKIAELLEVPTVDLLDDYNRFLYAGQGRQIKALRKHMGLTQREFGKCYGVGTGAVKRWENDTARVTKPTWERLAPFLDKGPM